MKVESSNIAWQERVRKERDKVLARLNSLSARSPVPFLIVLDNRERVLAYMTYRSALDVLERSERGDQLIKLVNAGDRDSFDNGSGFWRCQDGDASAHRYK